MRGGYSIIIIIGEFRGRGEEERRGGEERRGRKAELLFRSGVDSGVFATKKRGEEERREEGRGRRPEGEAPEGQETCGRLPPD